MSLRWLPLESNPDVMNAFLKDLGLCDPWGISDVVSLDVDATDLVPQPCVALILLLPITDKYQTFTSNQEKELEKSSLPLPANSDVYFMKQTINNACGTIALIHAIGNNLERLNVLPDSILMKFLDSTRPLSPEDRGKKLEENTDIANLHEVGAHEGQSEAPSIDDDVDLHFIVFVNIGDHVVELDGRKKKPVVHCATDGENFLKDAFKVCQEYIAIDPMNLRYNAMSLGVIGQP